MELFDITTRTGDFIANGVVSHNCFARPTHTYLDFNAGRDFEKEIVVKVNVPEVARAELMRPSWKREHVALGTNTDPYQWVEGRYRLMPGIWEAMRDSGTPASVLTKSPLLLRDIELMKEIHARGGLRGEPVDPDARRARVACQRAAHAASAQADRGRRRAEPPGHSVRSADRASDARYQRRARAGGGDPRALRRGGRGEHRRHLPAPARRGTSDLHGLARLLPARPRSALRAPVRPRRVRPEGRARPDRRPDATRWPRAARASEARPRTRPGPIPGGGESDPVLTPKAREEAIQGSLF